MPDPDDLTSRLTEAYSKYQETLNFIGKMGVVKSSGLVNESLILYQNLYDQTNIEQERYISREKKELIHIAFICGVLTGYQVRLDHIRDNLTVAEPIVDIAKLENVIRLGDGAVKSLLQKGDANAKKFGELYTPIGLYLYGMILGELDVRAKIYEIYNKLCKQ